VVTPASQLPHAAALKALLPLPAEWFCSHEEDGSLREHQLNPSLATEDCFAKLTTFLIWISRNAPGWRYHKKNPNITPAVGRSFGFQALVSTTQCRSHLDKNTLVPSNLLQV
jgi:hypothetical protein